METDYNKILNIPPTGLLNQKLTKAFFLRNFELTAAEKKLLDTSILEMLWLASLRPKRVNIPKEITNTQTFEELQVIICSIGENPLGKVAIKVTDFIQKHLPFHILLIVENEQEFLLNTTEKFINKKDPKKRTFTERLNTPNINKLYKNEATEAFFKSLSFEALDKTNLRTTYHSYTEALTQYKAAAYTGRFKAHLSRRTDKELELIKAIEDLEVEIDSLLSKIKKETALNRRVELNIQLQKTRARIENLKDKLSA